MNEERLKRIAQGFSDDFGSIRGTREPIYVISAHGRVEILGKHTDHQHGCVVSGAVNLDTLGAATRNGQRQIRLYSEGYNPCMVHLSDLSPDKAAAGTTRSLVRGVAEGFARRGYEVGGFDAYLSSNVGKGSGLSSSASFETLVATAINLLFCDGAVSPVELARICHYAENAHFGKPCGMQDQLTCALGGILFIDFEDAEKPVCQPIEELLAGYTICIVECGADHAGLTPHYTAITRELSQIAGYFGKDHLRQVEKEELIRYIPVLREKVGDRAVLRALHVYAENQRVRQGTAALSQGDANAFFHHVRASGQSSFMYMQNVIAPGEVRHQHMAVALAMVDELLEGHGAFRIQGGGFAGTIEAFVPTDRLTAFQMGMESVLGAGSTMAITFRQSGAGLVGR